MSLGDQRGTVESVRTFAELLHAWIDAERLGDAVALDAVLADDFQGDGPLGYVLDKDGWLDRFRSRDLAVEAFNWLVIDATGSTTAVVVGLQSQVARYRGVDVSGEFMCTLVVVRRGDCWALVNLQLSQALGPISAWWSMSRTACARSMAVDAARSSGAASQRETQDMAEYQTQAPQMPTPDPALKQLDRFVGTWDMHGRTLDSDTDNVHGRATFEWLPGGFFFQQRIKLDFAGFPIEAVEIIGYDPQTGTFPSTVYASMAGMPLPYRWEINADELTITTEALGATFRGRWSADGTTFSGGWRPNPGREGPGNVPYDISGGRARA